MDKLVKILMSLGSLIAYLSFLLSSQSVVAGNLALKSTNSAVKASANYSDKGAPASYAFDGNLSTSWKNADNDFHFYDHLVVDLGNQADINSIAAAIELKVEVVENSEDKAALFRSKAKIDDMETKLKGILSTVGGIRGQISSAYSIRDSTSLKNAASRLSSSFSGAKSQTEALRQDVVSLRGETSDYSFLATETVELIALDLQLVKAQGKLLGGIIKLTDAKSIPDGYYYNGGLPQEARSILDDASRQALDVENQLKDSLVELNGIQADLAQIKLEETPLGSKVFFAVEYFNGSDWQEAIRSSMSSTKNLVTVDLPRTITAQKWRIRDFKNEFGVAKHVSIYEWSINGTLKDGPVDPEINVADGDHWTELASAPIDECFVAPGSQLNQYPKQPGPCPSGTVNKRNEAYLWGMTHFKQEVAGNKLVDRLYFGSGANVMCLAIQTYLLIETPYIRNGDLVCEFSTNKDGLKDFRSPSLYIHDFNTAETFAPKLTDTADLLRQFTTGFRSAGNHNGIVFIGGPNLDNSVNMFAFLGATGTLIGGTVIDYGYSSFRKMRVIDGELYVGMGGAESPESSSGGAILRWKGNMSQILLGNTKTLFDFEVVGTGLAAEATEVNAYNGRVLGSSWPDEDTPTGGGLFISKELPLSAEAVSRKTVWEANSADSSISKLVFAQNGSLVLKDTAGSVVWSTPTGNKNAAKALMQDNGKLAIYDAEDALLWSNDPNWIPKYPRINTIAHENATRIEIGDELSVGETIKSRTGHYHLTLQQDGVLSISAGEIPWQKVWNALDYEPDPHVASTYGVGPARVFDGWVYWGTMHVPSAALVKYELELGRELPDEERGETLQAYHREGSIFRGRNLGEPNQEIQLLYGGQAIDDTMEPGYYPVRTSNGFEPQLNKMGQKPLYGKGGFDNPWNNYIWSMVVYNDDLYIGTMDHAQIALDDNLFIPYDLDAKSLIRNTYGSDLFKIENSNIGAMPVAMDGLGNPDAYGIRTMATDGTSVFMGTANNANLSKGGGWQLFRFTADEIEEPEAGSLSYQFLFGFMLLVMLRRRKTKKVLIKK